MAVGPSGSQHGRLHELTADTTPSEVSKHPRPGPLRPKGVKNMHRFILCAGANGSPAALEGLSRAASAYRPDGILFAGGVLGPDRRFALRSATLWGMPTEESLF